MRPFPGSVVSVQPQFQCTHPGWGATLESRQAKAELQFQSTHPGWGATLQKLQIIFINRVSIHAPRPGCDAQRLSGLRDYNKFQSTHPGRGATSMLCVSRSASFSFNPRTPGGVRLYKKERAESQGNMWYVLRTYWCGFPLNKLSDFSFKLSS